MDKVIRFNSYVSSYFHIFGTTIFLKYYVNKDVKADFKQFIKKSWYFSLLFLGTHLQEKPHICKECGMGFKESRNLKEHNLIIHEGIKFSCDSCGKEFKQKRHLDRHKKNVHKNVKVKVTE